MRINSVVRLALALSVASLAPTGRAAEKGAIPGAASAQANSQSAPPSAESGSPISVESLNFSICDSKTNKESASWIQLHSCDSDQKKIVTWPLLLFRDGINPKAMRFEKCLSDSQVSCGFDAAPKYWWVGPVGQGDPDLLPNPAKLVFSKSPLSQPKLRSKKDQLDGLLAYLEIRMAPVELAWRLGQSKNPKIPLFSLEQGAGNPQTSIGLGECGSLPLGKVTIGGITVNLKTECEPPGPDPGEFIRSVAKRSSRNFHWMLEEEDNPELMTPVNAGDSAEFVLFPYKIVEFEGKGRGIHRNGVPAPAESTSVLISLDIPAFVVTVAPPPGPPNEPVSMPAVVAGLIILTALSGFMWYLRQRRNAASPSRAGLQTREVHNAQGSAAVGQVAGTSQSSAVSLHPESLVQTREGTLAGVQEVIARLEGVARSLSGLQDATTRCVRESESARAAAAAADIRMKDFETRNADLRPRLNGLDKRLDETSVKVGAINATLIKEIDSRIEQAALEWSNMVLFDHTSPPALPNMPQGAAQPAAVEADVAKTLRPLYELSTFALEILRAWLGVDRIPMGNLEGDELGKPLSADLKVLEAIVHIERPLWSSWLGKLPSSSAANIVVRVATSKWSAIPATQQDAARLALQWADDRVPRLQTLVEAAPLECGSDDPSGLRKALIKAASKLSDSADGEDEVISLSKMSTLFHALVEKIYSAAGAQYLPVRLYQDTIQSHDIPYFIEETHAAYPFAHSNLLVDKRIADRHGLIVRITQPLSKRRDRTSGKWKWEGSLYFLETRKP